MVNNKESPILKNPSSPMWKTFMITDIDRIERTSATMHAKAQRMEDAGIGLLPEKEKLVRIEEKPEEKKADVYHDPEEEPMPKPEIIIRKPQKELGLADREIFLKPAVLGCRLPLGIDSPLPSRTEDLHLEMNGPSFSTGSGMFMPKLRGFRELRDRKGETKE